MEPYRDDSTTLALKDEGTGLISQAESIVIDSLEAQKQSDNFLARVIQLTKRIKEYWAGPKRDAHQTWRGICDREAEMLRIPEEARTIIENKRRKFRDSEREKAAAEQRKADELRRKEEERLKKKELGQAERAMDKGDLDGAQEHMEAADGVFVPPTTVQPAIATTERTDNGALIGVMDIRIEVVDMKAVAGAVAQGLLPDHLLELRLGAAKTWAKGNGFRNCNIHGLSVIEYERTQFRESKANKS